MCVCVCERERERSFVSKEKHGERKVYPQLPRNIFAELVYYVKQQKRRGRFSSCVWTDVIFVERQKRRMI